MAPPPERPDQQHDGQLNQIGQLIPQNGNVFESVSANITLGIPDSLKK